MVAGAYPGAVSPHRSGLPPCLSSRCSRDSSRCCRRCRSRSSTSAASSTPRSRTGTRCDVRWALMYPDAYEVGLPNQGVMILYEVLNEQPRGRSPSGRTPCGRTSRPLMREHGVPQFTVDGHRPVGAFDVLGVVLLHRARLHQPAPGARPRRHPAARRGPRRGPPDRARRRARGVQPRADRRLHRRRGARRRRAGRARDHRRSSGRWKAEGSAPGGRDELLLRLAAHRRRLRAALLRRGLPAGRPHQAGRAEPARRAVAGAQAHRHGPRRVAVPEAAAGAAGRDGARARLASRSSAAAPAAAASARPA